MAQFERYHPIMTAHYQLDWLTQFKLTDINRLRQLSNTGETVVETANYVNRQMSTIMQNQALIWGIQDKTSQQFNGIIGLSKLTDKPREATLVLTLTPDADARQVVSELVEHTVAFADKELHRSTLIIADDVPLKALFLQNGFVSNGTYLSRTVD